jgi:predicted RNA-binding protein (virulence factor B family)
MISIGKYQILYVKRQLPQGLYLGPRQGKQEVLLPQTYVTSEMEIGQPVEVLVYLDNEGLAVATTEVAALTVGQYAYLEVGDVNPVGAFCNWGVRKQLFVPFANQQERLEVGKRYIVYMYLDEASRRLVGTTKLKGTLRHEAGPEIKQGQEVDILIWEATPLGWRVIVDHTYSGMLYRNEVRRNIQIGDQLKGYVKPLRPDGKLDISLHPVGHERIAPTADTLLQILREREGFLPLTDKSDPDLIRQELGMSKKLFKQALGSLYKQRLVVLEKGGVRLN